MSKQELEQEPEVSKAIWLYHKELGAVLFESAEEVAALDKKEWFDHPEMDKKQDAPKKFKGPKALDKMSKVELVQAGLSVGLEKEKIVGLSKDELIALLA